MHPDDIRIPASFDLAKKAGMEFTFSTVTLKDAHPNTAVLRLSGEHGRKIEVQAASIGGGLADLLTAPMWAPATILIKALITLPFTWKGRKLLCTRNRIAPFVSWILSTIGYYLAEGLLFGQYAALITSVMGSALQSGGSLLFF